MAQVLELCCFECLPNDGSYKKSEWYVLELCCFECLPNDKTRLD